MQKYWRCISRISSKMNLKIILKALLFLPSTFLHELTHALFGIILGRIESFSILPRISGGNIILGSVIAGSRLHINIFLIAVSPLIWWIMIYFYVESAFFSSVEIAYSIYALWILAFAGKLSMQDIKVGIVALAASRTKYIFILFFLVVIWKEL